MTTKPTIKKSSTVKAVDGLGNNVKDYIYNPAENKFEHKDDLVHVSSSEKNLRTINELKDLKKYQDSTNIHHPSYGTYQEPTVGTTAHRKKYPARYGYHYTSNIEQAAYPIPGTAPSEKINKEPLVKQFRSDSPDTYLSHPDQQKGMLLATIEDAKPKPKKINKYAEVKIPIPVIDHALLRKPKHEVRDAALEKLRVYAFTPRVDPDESRGIGSFKKTIGKQLRAANSKRDWEKANKTIYKDSDEEN